MVGGVKDYGLRQRCEENEKVATKVMNRGKGMYFSNSVI